MRSLPGQLGDIQGSRAEPPSTVTRLSSLSSTRTTRGSLLSCGPLAEQVEVFGGCKVCEGIAEFEHGHRRATAAPGLPAGLLLPSSRELWSR